MTTAAVRLRPAPNAAPAGTPVAPSAETPAATPVEVLARAAAVPPTLAEPWLHAHAVAFRLASGAAGALGAPDGGAPNTPSGGVPNAFGGPAQEFPLPASLAGAAPRRLATFLAGRHCAREALRAAGLADPPAVGRLTDGGPAWPPGFVGSITHTDDRAAAAVARRADARALGIDCERVLAAAEAAEVRRLVIAPAEAAGLTGAGALPEPLLVTVLFSAKESVYKCLRATVGAFFEFHDVHAAHVHAPPVAPDGRGVGRVALRVARDLGGGVTRGVELEAAFAVVDGHVHTRVALRP